ncbi:competence pheromone ComX [Lysinibacillus sp. KU-BSD001]|uniref:competence pheromone ComX n=1 Tax=Lysinibacillus sp. KU-BSD001 TaxID=3141328 RepID=UPI0036E01844
MIKMIQFLQENANIVELLKEKKVSLVGVTETETQAMLEAFKEELKLERSNYWQ